MNLLPLFLTSWMGGAVVFTLAWWFTRAWPRGRRVPVLALVVALAIAPGVIGRHSELAPVPAVYALVTQPTLWRVSIVSLLVVWLFIWAAVVLFVALLPVYRRWSTR